MENKVIVVFFYSLIYTTNKYLNQTVTLNCAMNWTVGFVNRSSPSLITLDAFSTFKSWCQGFDLLEIYCKVSVPLIRYWVWLLIQSCSTVKPQTLECDFCFTARYQSFWHMQIQTLYQPAQQEQKVPTNCSDMVDCGGNTVMVEGNTLFQVLYVQLGWHQVFFLMFSFLFYTNPFVIWFHDIFKMK